MSTAADFLKAKTSGNLCGYAVTKMLDGKVVYGCGNPQGDLANGTFDEPCTTTIWDTCPLNARIPYSDLIRYATQGGLPGPGESWEIQLPTGSERSGIKYTIENKEGKIRIFRIVIYQRGSSKPPKTVVEEVLPV